MEISTVPESEEIVSPYLPKTTREIVKSRIITSIAYAAWKRSLTKFGPYKKSDTFKLLEVGCGPGYFLRCMRRWFPNSILHGLDIDGTLLDFAATQLHERIELTRHRGEELPFPESSFDVVCSFQVIEHLERPESFFKESHRILRSKGLLLIATPNPAGICAKTLGEKWAGYRFDHISLKPPKEWREIATSTGFKIITDGTTGLTGFPILRTLPFALVNWVPMAMLGFFPWLKGESYMAVIEKAK